MGIITLIGLALIVFSLVLMVQAVQGRNAGARGMAGMLLVAGIAIAILSRSFLVVPAGNVGVVFNALSGVKQRELNEGLNFVLPIIESVTLFDAREQSFTFAAEPGADDGDIEALSQEGLQIDIDATIRFEIDKTEAASIYQDIGPSYVAKLVRPQVRSAIRNSVANYKAAEVISTRRSELETEIETDLAAALEISSVRLIDVLLRDVRIPETISLAIERKQAAEQEVEIEENLRLQAQIAAQRAVTEAEGLRDAAIAKAQGEAEALTLKGQAIRENPEIIQLEIAEKLAPTISTIMLPTESNMLLDMKSILNKP